MPVLRVKNLERSRLAGRRAGGEPFAYRDRQGTRASWAFLAQKQAGLNAATVNTVQPFGTRKSPGPGSSGQSMLTRNTA